MTFNPLTFTFELINFVVLAVLLQRMVYRPVAEAIRARRAEIEQTRATAAERLALVDQRAEALAARDQELDQLRTSIISEATAAASTGRAKLLAQARDDAAAERQRAHAMLEAEREAAVGWVREVTVDRGVEVAGKLLLQLVPDAAHEALVERLLVSVAARTDLGAPDHEPGDVHADATFAQLPTAEQSRRLRHALEEAVGQHVLLSVTEDDRLGAGATVRIRDRVFDASVSGQLELLRDDARQLLTAEAG